MFLVATFMGLFTVVIIARLVQFQVIEQEETAVGPSAYGTYQLINSKTF